MLSKVRHGSSVTVQDGQRMDVFCLGLVLLGMMTARDVRECYQRGAVSDQRIRSMLQQCEAYSDRLVELVSRMLALPDEERITIQ